VATYFVRNGGSDAASGLSDALAWATIAKVNGTALAAGDIVQLKRGSEWREELNLGASGTAGNPIIVQDYSTGAKPILKGSALAATWVNHSGNVWRISLATDPNIVWFDGTRGTEKGSVALLVGVREWFYDATADRLYVWSTSDPDSAFTAPGIEYGVRNSAINTDSKSNVTYKNLDIRHGRGATFGVGLIWVQNSVSNITLDSLDVSEGYAHGISTTGVNCTGFILQDCTVEGFGDCGYTNNQNNTVDQNILRNVIRRNGWRVSSGSGMIVRISSGEIANNTIYENGIGSSGTGTRHGIYIANGSSPADPGDVLVHDNECYDHPNGSGFTVKSSCEVYDNNSHDNSHDGLTTGENNTAATIVIYRNRFTNNGKYGLGQNIVGTAALRVRFYHNTVYGGERSVNIDNDLAELDIRNNIFAIPDTGSTLSPFRFELVQTGLTCDYNLYLYRSTRPVSWGGATKTWAEWQALGYEAHGIDDTDPEFTDAAGDDYTLQSTSPAIDVGVAVADINDGFFGDAPDLGYAETEPVSTDRRAKVTWLELETPSVNTDRRARVTQVALEIPEASRRVEVYQVAFSVEDTDQAQWGFPIAVVPHGEEELHVRGQWVRPGKAIQF
jgi:hypothetical protein